MDGVKTPGDALLPTGKAPGSSQQYGQLKCDIIYVISPTPCYVLPIKYNILACCANRKGSPASQETQGNPIPLPPPAP